MPKFYAEGKTKSMAFADILGKKILLSWH